MQAGDIYPSTKRFLPSEVDEMNKINCRPGFRYTTTVATDPVRGYKRKLVEMDVPLENGKSVVFNTATPGSNPGAWSVNAWLTSGSNHRAYKFTDQILIPNDFVDDLLKIAEGRRLQDELASSAGKFLVASD